jgi:hypothetical protein
MASGERSTWASKSAGKVSPRARVDAPCRSTRRRSVCSLFVGDQGQICERSARARHDASEQGGEVRGDPLDGRGVEEIRRVLEGAEEPLGPLHHPEREIDLRRGALRSCPRAPDRASAGPRGAFCSVKSTWKMRRAAEIAHGLELLHQALEGQLLVGIGPQAGLAHPGEQLDEGELSSRVGAENEVLRKKPISPSVSGCVR